jgi:hypothetical protein
MLKKKTDRSIISRLRVSAHNVAIEKGHFSVPTDKRSRNFERGDGGALERGRAPPPPEITNNSRILGLKF